MKNFLQETVRKILFEMNYDEAVAVFKKYGNVDPETISKEELKKIYRELAVQFHPDKNPNAGDILTNINVAHELLQQGRPAGGGSGGYGGGTSAEFDKHRADYENLKRQYEKMKRDHGFRSTKDMFDDFKNNRQSYTSQENPEDFQYTPQPPSTFEKFSSRFKKIFKTGEEWKMYKEFKKERKMEEKSWNELYKSGRWNDETQRRYDEWKKNKDESEKKWQKILQQI